MSRAPALAALIPLWRALQERGTTVLVTPALDYIGALELTGIDIRYVSSATLEGSGEALRTFVAGLEESCTLHFLYRVYEDAAADIRAYQAETAEAQPAVLAAYVEARAAFLRGQRVRRTGLYLFFSTGGF